MVASRVLTSRISERHLRFKRLGWLLSGQGAQSRRLLASSVQHSPPVWCRSPDVGVSAGLVPFRRNVSTTVQKLQLPAEVPPEDPESAVAKKKSILGLDFLTKLFGRNQEAPAAVSQAETSVEEADANAADSGLYNGEQAYAAESSELQDTEQAYAAEESEMQNGEQAYAAEESELQAEEQPSEELDMNVSRLEAEQAAEEPAAQEHRLEAAFEETVEGITGENTAADAVAEESTSAKVAELIKEAKEDHKSDLSASVQDFIKSLPPLSEAVTTTPAVTSSTSEKVVSPAKTETPPAAPAASEKSAATKTTTVAKPAEKSATKTPASVSEKPAATTTKPAAATEKPAVNAETSAATVTAKPAVKAPVKTVKKPPPPQPGDSSSVPTPIFEFLRSKIIENNGGGNAASDKATPETQKPTPLKLSPRLEALSSSQEKANAAINMLLDTVEKSGKSPAAPIFDALNDKQEETSEAPASTPSLRLSLSTPPSEPAPMDAQTLMGEMNTRLTDGKIPEAVTLFEDWRSAINPLTMECNKPDRTLYNLYMQAKLKVGSDYEELNEVVSEMEEAGLPRDLAGYNILIRALFRKKDSSTAEKLLERMENEEPQAQPDADSYNLVVVLCALDRKVQTATKYMKRMIEKGFEPSRTTVNEVLLASARSHQTQLAASLLKDLKASGKLPMPMLNTCAELLMAASEIDDAECARLALAAISERPMARFGPKMILDEGTMICVLGTAARTGDTVLSKNAWEALSAHTKGLGRSPSPEAFLARIHALSMTGDIANAFKTVWEFELNHGKKGDVDTEAFSPFTSLKSLASACSRGGAAALDAAYYKLEEAHTKKQGVAVAAINCVILACGNLWDSERAFQTFEAIENMFGLRPDIHSCNALIHALGRTKMTDDALKVYDYIKEAGFKPDKWTYMLLTDAHVVNHDANAALGVLQTMIEGGHLPFRQTTMKVWTRCKQHDDNEALERLTKMEQDLNYRHSYFASARRKLLLDVIRS